MNFAVRLSKIPNIDDCYIILDKYFSRKEGLYYFRKDEDENGQILVITDIFDDDLKKYYYDMICCNVKFVIDNFFDRSLFDNKFCYEGGQLDEKEKIFLYNFIQKIKPKKIMEIGSGKGCSTTIISKSLKDLGQIPDYFDTHEINEEYVIDTKKSLNKYNIDFVNVKHGNVFDTMDREKLKDIDFLFVDSDHSKEFSERYINEFFSLLKDGCWVGVHDMRFHPDYVTDETILIQSYIKDNNIKEYFSVADLLKLYKMSCEFSEFEHCCRSTLFFFRNRKNK